MAIASTLCPLIAISGLLGHQPLAIALVAAAAGLAGWAFATLAIVRPRHAREVALAGAAVILANAVVHTDRPFPAVAVQVASGIALVILGLFRAPGLDAPRAAVTPHRPLSLEGRRLLHGLGWGAAATLPMAAVTCLALAVRLWPLERPLSVLVARELLGDVGGPWIVLAVAAAQLAYGALSGCLLAAVSERVTMTQALALGLLRWLLTQLIVFSVLGWAEFALERTPVLALATVLPHLAYALALGWGMRRDHLTGELPGPAFAAR